MNFADLESARQNTRAVVVVHPNNPTGSFVHPEDADRLVALCRDRGWALVADEVFSPYVLDGGRGDDRTFASVNACPCFALGGFSKSLGLPQLKLAWMVVNGPESSVSAALEGLDYVADTYLSVCTPVALAAPGLLAAGAAIRGEISERCRTNLGSLRRLAAEHPAVEVLNTGGGWSAVVRIPAIEDEESLCARLLEDHGVAVHPGFFFDFPRDGYLVLSLLPPRPEFAEGIGRVLDAVESSLTRDR
jgi:aspartate/methionine/tyrosine aminotransferase